MSGDKIKISYASISKIGQVLYILAMNMIMEYLKGVVVLNNVGPLLSTIRRYCRLYLRCFAIVDVRTDNTYTTREITVRNLKENEGFVLRTSS